MTAIAIRKDSMRTMQANNDGSESGISFWLKGKNRYQERRRDMTLFTKRNCTLCDQLKERFELAAMDVTVEVLDMNSPGALAHLAWHSLVDTARRTLPLLVLDDSSAVSDYANITGTSKLIRSVHPESHFFPDGYTKLFPIREEQILEKIKENKKLCGDVLGYVAQIIPQIDAEIFQKGRFRTETN